MSGDIGDELIIMTKLTFEHLMKSKNNADVCTLYLFYYYVSKWQKTNRIYSTTGYTANGLGWTEARVRKAKKELIDMGLVEDVKTVDSKGRITGRYIHMKYRFKAENEASILTDIHTEENPYYGLNDTMANQETNAYSNNNKMLTVNNKEMLTEKIEKCLSVKEVVSLFNEICVSMPNVKLLSDSRKQAVRNAAECLNQAGMDFESYFRKVEKSDFLSGRGDWKGATFDWILKRSNMIKVIEGNYDNRNNDKPKSDPYGYGAIDIDADTII